MEQGPRIFRKLIRDKLFSPRVNEIATYDLFELVAYFILCHMEPISNMQSYSNKHMLRIRETMERVVRERVTHMAEDGLLEEGAMMPAHQLPSEHDMFIIEAYF